jgi:protein SCO1/2
MKVWVISCLFLFSMLQLSAGSIVGRVLEVSEKERFLKLEILRSGEASPGKGEHMDFRVAAGDAEIGYAGRVIRANAVHYNGTWHLEQVFPLTGPGSKEMFRQNNKLHRATESKGRGDYVREGDPIPDFGMVNQNGDIVLMRDLRGRPFVMNFIFTRCQAPEMCPASSTRMAAMQEAAEDRSLNNLQFVTITFDPEFDSPGILRKYAEGYGMDFKNFHLLTGTKELIDNLLRQFGILTVEEDGTINHTMATLLVDAGGKVAYRKEGSTWTVEEFLDAAADL